MKEQIKQALIKETERHIAQDILYDDVYVGPFTEKDGVDCAIHAVDWYCNHIWHDASEEPSINSIIIYKCNGCVPDTGRFFGIACTEGRSSWEVFKYPQSYILNNIEKWAYLDDILPDSSNSDD